MSILLLYVVGGFCEHLSIVYKHIGETANMQLLNLSSLQLCKIIILNEQKLMLWQFAQRVSFYKYPKLIKEVASSFKITIKWK